MMMYNRQHFVYIRANGQVGVLVGLGKVDLQEAKLHVIVDVVASQIVRWRDHILARIGVASLDDIDVLQLWFDFRLTVAPQRDHDIGIGVRGQIEGIPGDANLAGVLLVHIIGGKEDLLGSSGWGLYKVLAAPLKALCAHGNLETNVTLGLEERLYAYHTITIHIGAQHGLRIEVTGDTNQWIKTWSCYVNHLTAQHVTRLGRKCQRQQSSVYQSANNLVSHNANCKFNVQTEAQHLYAPISLLQDPIKICSSMRKM